MAGRFGTVRSRSGPTPGRAGRRARLVAALERRGDVEDQADPAVAMVDDEDSVIVAEGSGKADVAVGGRGDRAPRRWRSSPARTDAVSLTEPSLRHRRRRPAAHKRTARVRPAGANGRAGAAGSASGGRCQRATDRAVRLPDAGSFRVLAGGERDVARAERSPPAPRGRSAAPAAPTQRSARLRSASSCAASDGSPRAPAPPLQAVGLGELGRQRRGAARGSPARWIEQQRGP